MKIEWVCGGDRGTSVVLADRHGVVIGSDGFVNGFFFFFFFLTWFCFWFDGLVVVLGNMRVVACSLCCYFEAVWW